MMRSRVGQNAFGEGGPIQYIIEEDTIIDNPKIIFGKGVPLQ